MFPILSMPFKSYHFGSVLVACCQFRRLWASQSCVQYLWFTCFDPSHRRHSTLCGFGAWGVQADVGVQEIWTSEPVAAQLEDPNDLSANDMTGTAAIV